MNGKRVFAGAAAAVLLAALGGYLALPGAHVTDIYPLEGMVQPGQPVHLRVKVERPWYDFWPVQIAITHGLSTTPIAVIRTRGGEVTWTPSAAGGYGVTASVRKSQAATAVDVGDRWTDKPRYGFLADFHASQKGQSDRFETMAKFHINGLQFYDWMYNHADYIPPTDEFKDPLGRHLALSTVKDKIDLSHRQGMAAMAYTAIYAAPREFYEAHKDWALYDRNGEPMNFGNGFLYIMNPEAGSEWAKHIVAQYGKIVTDLPFDGIHLDQYGDPKSGFRYPGGENAPEVKVDTAIRDLINATKGAVGDSRAVIFNDVTAWPLEQTAPTKNDAVYIEVWPPYVNFDHLHQLIGRGRQLSNGKPVVLAAYIKADYEPSVILSDAVIFASGGYHLELGEGDNLLADPYFPKYRKMSAALAERIRRYYDVRVRYQDLLDKKDLQDWTPEVTVADSPVLKNALFGGVWPVGRENATYGTLSLINLNGLTDAKWTSDRKAAPTLLEKREVTVSMAAAPKALYLINPDGPDQSPVRVKFTYKGGKVSFTVDRLEYWSMLVFEK